MINKPSLRRRSAGVLLHLSSLPGPHGVGDLGPCAYRFVDFLGQAAQGWWQMLPVGPAGAGHSPYSSPSAFAGEPLFISLELLVEDGLLSTQDLVGAPSFPIGIVDHDAARAFKTRLLRKAFSAFIERGSASLWTGFKEFAARHSDWLEDWGRFCALKERAPGASWLDWEAELRRREFRRWGQASLREFGEAASREQFLQFLFARQWRLLKAYALERGIGLIGDVPIYVAQESSDVWAHQDLFQLADDGRPTVVAGVPPDYFSETGQLWGNPVYRWDELGRRGYDWWLSRLAQAAERFDAVRLDHFIGFQRYWEIPASAKTAKEGRWVQGPGADFFAAVGRNLPDLALIAEDLGAVTPEVTALRERFDLPGLRVLQFAFGSDQQAESFLPHNYPRRCVAYAGTHDNDTSRGWFESSSRPDERQRALRYLGSDGKEPHRDILRAVLGSTADTAIVTAQDLLGLGPEARMNLPGTSSGQWRWRLREGQLDAGVAAGLRSLTEGSGRALETKV